MNGTAISSGLAVTAAFIQLSVAAAGISKDDDFYDHYYNGDYNGAMAANSIMVFAACLALIGGAWLLLIAVIAVCKEQTSFQMHFTPVQHVNQQQQQQQQQQQLMPLNYPNTITIHPPMSSQVVQMPVAYMPMQTMTNSTVPNQQVLSVPIQYVLPQQQLISMNHPPPNTIDPATFAQVHGQHEAPKSEDRDAEKF